MSGAQLVIAFDSRIGNLEAALKKVEAGLSKTSREASGASRAVTALGRSTTAAQAQIDSLAKSSDGLGTSLANAARSASSGIGGGLAGIGSTLRAVASAAGPVGIAIGTITAAATGAALALGRITAPMVELVNTAAGLGTSTTTLQTVQVALQQVGATAETATGGLRTLGENVQKALTTDSNLAATFLEAGVALTTVNGTARSTTDVFNSVTQAIRGAATEQQALALATAAFGARDAAAFVRVAREMAGTTDDWAGRMRAAGLIVGDDTPAALARLDTAMGKVSTATGNLGRAVSVELAEAVRSVEPTLTAFFNWLAEKITNATASLRAIGNDVRSIPGTLVGPLNPTPGSGSVEQDTRRLAQANQLLAEAQAQVTRGEISPTQAEAFLRPYRERVTAIEAAINGARTLAQVNADELRRRTGQATATRETLPLPPDFVPPPADAGARTGGGAARAVRDVDTALRDAIRTTDAFGTKTDDALARVAERIADAGAGLVVLRDRFAAVQQAAATNARPLTDLESQLARDGESLIAGVTNAENYQRALVAAAAQSAQAWRDAGIGQTEIASRINTSLDAIIERMVKVGQVSEEAGARIRAAVGSSPALVPPGTTFGQGISQGVGLDQQGQPQQTLAFNIGQGLGKIAGQFGASVVDTLDDIATKSVDAGEAITRLAADFAKAVAAMIVQALALRAVQAIVGALFGPSTPAPASTPAAPSLAAFGFGGFRMAGGPVSAGMSYIVGERGPEIFTPTGSGRITANGAMAGPQLIINNNAPGVVVTQQQVDERTVIAAVNLSRTEVTRDFQRSIRNGHGPYAESLSGSFNVRRRL